MGLPMENDLLPTISEQIMKPESKFGKNLLSLTLQSINIVLIDHLICHMTIVLKILKLTKLVVGFKKRKSIIISFSFILINLYHITFGMTVHCTSIKKKWAKTSFLTSKFNFELLRTCILNFWCIHAKRRKKYICTRYLKRQFIYPNKVDSLLIHYFIHFQCHVTIF